MESVIDLDKRYRLARARELLPRAEGGVERGWEESDNSGLGVLLQYRAPAKHIPQPPPLCFENEWQPQYDASLCEAPLKLKTLSVPVINEARLLGPGIVFARNDVILSESVGRHAERFGLENGDDGTWALSANLRELAHRAQSEGAVSKHESTALLLCDPAVRHFGMWVLKCLPKLRVLPLLTESDVRVVVPIDVPDKYLTLMQSLGVSSEQIVFHDPQSITVFRRLLVPPKIYTFARSHFGNPFEVFCTGARRNHREPSRLTLPTPGPERIYVSRRGNRRRRLADEKAVERRFAEFGFRVVEPSKLTAVETLLLFRDCKFIGGPFGSGLYNVLFSRRAPKELVLIPPVMKFDKQFLTAGHVCTSMGGNAGYIFGRMREGSSGQAKKFDYSWEIDMDRLRDVLVTLTGDGA